MRKSIIFDNFVKIAAEKGLIDPKAVDKAKDILEKNPRMDSKSAEDIAKLYGVKPETSQGMNYDRNIVELAHPTSAIIAPAYDKLNSLLENENERQDITINIINKHVRGLHTKHKYAQEELLLSLIRTANDLDARNEEELRKLADVCLEQISGKSMKKIATPAIAAAFTPWTLIPAFFGGLYIQQHMNAVNEGFENSYQRLNAELDDFLNSNSNYGIGVDYKPEFLQTVRDFKDKITGYYNLYKKAEPLINEIEKPHTSQEAIEAAKKYDNSAPKKARDILEKASRPVLEYCEKIKQTFSKEAFKARQIQDKGVITSLIDKMQVFHGGKGLISDDFDDVVQAIPAFTANLQEINNIFVGAGTMENSLSKELQAATAKENEIYNDRGSNTQNAPQGMLAQYDQKAGDLTDQDLKSLENSFKV